jgi:tripartite-type tricarboxylate transporter receptor subunit TctC
MHPRFFVSFAALVIAASFSHPASSQNYPNRVIRIVAAEAGGTGDVAARVIAQGLAGSLGQPVIVENRGGGVIAGEMVAKSAADGYTLLLYGNTFWFMPLMRSNMSYDPVKDFAPVTLAVSTPSVLVVHQSVAVTTVRELVALAKAKPGALNYSSAAAGTPNHLAAELFKSMAAINMVRVPYKGHASALNAVVAGEVQVMFPTVGLGMAQVKAGRLKALAVTSAEPTAQAPGVITMAAAGLPGYDAVLLMGIFAPAGTPAPIVGRLNREIVGQLERAEIKERLTNVGFDVVGSSPEQFGARIKSELAIIGKVIRDAGIRDE